MRELPYDALAEVDCENISFSILESSELYYNENKCKMAKVAFYDANVNCKQIYETNHFSLYNGEKTLILDNKAFITQKEKSVIIALQRDLNVNPWEE